jgi:hypothetical protein
MNKDKIKQLRLLARTLENVLEEITFSSHHRNIKDAMHSFDELADWFDHPVKLVKDRFGNPNIDVRLEGNDLVFKPDFSKLSKWTIPDIQDYIRGYDWIEPFCNIEAICICDIDFDECVVDFETKEIRINADYYVSLL